MPSDKSTIHPADNRAITYATDADWERFWQRVKKHPGDGCWEWIGALSTGYGVFSFKRIGRTAKSIRAHRFVWLATIGEIPEGLVIDHFCNNTRCVRLEHLRVVTNRVNILRGRSPIAALAAAVECVNGHPFDDTNTRKESGHRRCRACGRVNTKLYDDRLRVKRLSDPSRVEPMRFVPGGYCSAGHLLSDENWYQEPKGRMACRTCRAAYRAAYWRRMAAKAPPVAEGETR